MRLVAKRIIWGLHAALRGAQGNGPAFCLACKRSAPAFLPYRNGSSGLSPVLRDLGIVGSNLDRFRCPHCGSTDRERHLLAYLDRLQHDLFRDRRILHFAPEPSIQRLIKQHAPKEYIQADLLPASPEVVRMDITAIPFEANRFDLIIANHVLEHVDNDAQALREIHRVLSQDGFAILQTPFSPQLPATMELPAIRSPAARLVMYGQEDHVRLYGADIVKRIEASGLESCMKTHEDVMPDVGAALYGVNADEPLFLFAKRT